MGVCSRYISAAIKCHDQKQFVEKVFILVYDSRGRRVHSAREACLSRRLEREAERSHLILQA